MRWQLALPSLFLLIGCLGCLRHENPEIAYQHARATFVHGDLAESQHEAELGWRRFRGLSPEWAWKFKILEAEAMLWRGKYPQVLELLDSDPARPTEKDSIIRVLTLDSVANARTHQYEKADRDVKEADGLCADSAQPACGDLLRARGVLANQRGEPKTARSFFEQSLSFAESHGDRLLQATALLNLGAIALQEHPDEAIDWSESAYKAAAALNALDLMQTALGNLGWAYYRLGDSERALQVFLEAEQHAAQLGDVIDELTWARGAGRVYADLHRTEEATQAYKKALDLAEQSNAKDDVYGAELAMSWLALQNAKIDDATQDADRALEIAKASGKHVDELYPTLVQGQIAARRGDAPQAQSILQNVESDADCPPSLKWEAQHSLAQLYENQKQFDAADREYRAALATFEAERANVRHQDFRLSFLTNAAHIYDDYVHFLVERKKPDEALRQADYSRARTLSEGLGLLSHERPNAGIPSARIANAGIKKGTGKSANHGARFTPPPLNARAVAARANAVVLYYWLGEKQSYLWAITSRHTELCSLPPASEIEAAIQRYRRALAGPIDVLAPANPDGQYLYQTLISPAPSLLSKGGLSQGVKVVVIPDGNLNNLNFETLIVPAPAPHYWIEDAVVTNSSSLRVFAASFEKVRTKNKRSMMLIGNSVAPSEEFPVLPNAAAQMDDVARHFADAERHVFSGADATPAAYLAGHPEQFSYIHFVAHGTASRLSPLDSAIVLSRVPTETDSFKLYARDIIGHTLRADLVTISACYGAGERSYSGEGLVGLAWAFLRAGAHNVIGALWEVTDASTEQMMNRFYDELDKGSSPDVALRSAKLSLLHGSAFHNPFYWAPFQLYAGS